MMIVAAWLVHCVLISAVLAAGAGTWELSARWSGKPARWAWLGALAGSVTLPWLLRLVPERALPEVMPAVVSSAMSPVFLMPAALEPAAYESVGGSAMWSSVELALLAWVLMSLLVVGYVVRVVHAVARARVRWRQADVDGARVYITRNMGPAALGVREGVIVLPGWALRLETGFRSLLLLHEREHLRAGDPRLVFAGLMLLAAMPWNPVVWFIVLRLRNAIELDCDSRVLASGVDPRLYGSLLLEVGSRRGSGALVMATFAEPRLFLEERIRRIARWPLERRPGKAAVFAVAALALFATALSARDPLRPPALLGGALATADGGGAPADGAGPAGMPEVPANAPDGWFAARMTQRPELRNPWDVQDQLQATYPELLRRANLGGTAHVWMLIGAEGAVQRVQLARSSGYPALDEAATRVGAAMKFHPALHGSDPIAVWVEVPVVFGPAPDGAVTRPLERDPDDEHVFVITADEATAGADGAAAQAENAPAEARGRAAARSAPARQPPELLNTAEVFRELLRNYPPMLLDAGVGGVAVAWFFVDTDGRVLRTQMASSSGHRALDELALGVAGMMRFRPSVRDGAAEQAWVEIPFVFGAGQRLPVPAPRDGIVALPALIVTPTGMGATPQPIPRPLPAAAEDISSRPTFTPMTVRPELQNSAEVSRALVRHYPPMLRDAGVGGSPVVWFFISEEGRVLRTQLSRSSGHEALDDAALRVAMEMRFSPALNRNQPVAVWVEIPIMFSSR